MARVGVVDAKLRGEAPDRRIAVAAGKVHDQTLLAQRGNRGPRILAFAFGHGEAGPAACAAQP